MDASQPSEDRPGNFYSTLGPAVVAMEESTREKMAVEEEEEEPTYAEAYVPDRCSSQRFVAQVSEGSSPYVPMCPHMEAATSVSAAVAPAEFEQVQLHVVDGEMYVAMNCKRSPPTLPHEGAKTAAAAAAVQEAVEEEEGAYETMTIAKSKLALIRETFERNVAAASAARSTPIPLSERTTSERRYKRVKTKFQQQLERLTAPRQPCVSTLKRSSSAAPATFRSSGENMRWVKVDVELAEELRLKSVI